MRTKVADEWVCTVHIRKSYVCMIFTYKDVDITQIPNLLVVPTLYA